MPIPCHRTDCLHEMRGECFADGAGDASDTCVSYTNTCDHTDCDHFWECPATSDQKQGHERCDHYSVWDMDPKAEARAYKADMAVKGDEDVEA